MGEREPRHSKERNQPEGDPIPKVLFELGQVVVTTGAIETLARINRHPIQLIARHAEGNWGQLPEQDVKENEFSLEHGFRLFSAYNIEDTKFYVITEHDRSITTVLRADEY